MDIDFALRLFRMPQQDTLTKQLQALPVKNLQGYARMMRLDTFSSLRKSELIQRIIGHWDSSYDYCLEQDLKEKEMAPQKKIAKARVTRSLKEWVVNSKGRVVKIGFPRLTGKNRDIPYVYWGKIKVVNSVESQAEGKVVEVEPFEELPQVRVGDDFVFFFEGYVPRFGLGKIPSYRNTEKACFIETPFDADPVYK